MDVVINVKNVGKKYHLGQIGSGSKGKKPDSKKADALSAEQNKSFWALKDINFTVNKGEVLGVIGANGSGKSTLLKILSRITAPTTGELSYKGRIASMLEVGTGFNPEMTGRENIYLNGAILGMSSAEVSEKLQAIIDFSECEEFIDTPVKRYSSGMYVKLAFSVAAHLDSDILIMDEVLAVGDVQFQQKCLDKMHSVVQDEGRTVIFVTHSLGSLRQLCTRCIVLKKGQMTFDGNVEDAIEFYTGNVRVKEIRREFDISGKQSPDKKALLTGLSILDKGKPEYTAEEKIRIQIDWISLTEKKDVFFRCVIKHNGIHAVGMFRSERFAITPNRNMQSELVLDVSLFAEGHYTADIFIGTVKDGLVNAFDGQNQAFGFTLLSNKNQNDMKWASGVWGACILPTIDVINAEQ